MTKDGETMTKRILKLFLLLVVAIGLYMATNAKADGGAVVVTQTAQPPTMTEAAQVCNIKTGVDNGAVNLRSCAGTSCGVLDILTEGESLDILSAGLWMRVTTSRGFTGWINSNYCKGK